MPDSVLAQVLQECVQEVLEKMFFVQCFEGPCIDSAEPEIVAHLKFHGNPSGDLSVRLTSGAARSVAADFLGLDADEVSTEQVADVVCELGNMICGSVLSRVESASAFRLDTPQIIDAGHGESAPARDSATRIFELENGRLVVSIQTEMAECPLAAKSGF